MAITKTDFMRGMQCPKMLWLDKHKPSLKVIPPEIQAKLDAGNDFGDRAMGMFGPYEEMTVYRPGTTLPDKTAMLQRTWLSFILRRKEYATSTLIKFLHSFGSMMIPMNRVTIRLLSVRKS